MPSIRIESKDVILQGQDTGYNHAYLLLDDNDVADSSDVQIRGGDGTNGDIVIQAGLTIENSADARGSETPEDRGDRIVSMVDADDQWVILNQTASEIAGADITYTFPGTGVPVQNSNSVVATLLHTVGDDIGSYIPTNTTMAELTGSETILDFARNLTGTAGNDTIIGWHQNDILSGGDGSDLLDGDSGDDVLYGNTGDDHLIGGAGNDTLYGGQGNDHLEGGDGNDTLEGGLGIDVIDGGTGVNTVSYIHATSTDGVGVTVDLTQVGVAQDTHIAGMDTLTNIQNIIGSNYADTLTGDAHDNAIQGGGGNDTIAGGDGNDYLLGNQGDDVITGGNGNDYIHGGQGNDTLFGNVGDDQLHGGVGDDTLYGGQGNDTLYGESGTNALFGNLGADTFVMDAAGHDTIGDFSQAQGDKIDLFGIDAISTNAPGTTDHFTYVAGGVFTDVAGQLIIVQTDTTHYAVEGDINGDGHADYTLNVTSPDGTAPNQNAFTASSFATTAAPDVTHATAHDAFLFA